ncbi:ATP-binding protein, partial [Streptomyces sp. MCAF7]
VAGAFATAQRIAVRAAIEQAETREGISRVFLNLAQRSQGLVHRQLALLDTLERGSEDPDLLAELFRVDHLATRMRRNSENLSILGGAIPSRRWRQPVQLAEILRGAASQTEDYSRVKLTGIPEVMLAGPVAGDIMHLLSELVENATTFAPPHTSVQIHAEVVPKGLGIEIEDRGIGMADDVREELHPVAAEPEAGPAERSAEDAGRMMAMYQRQSYRGRVDAEQQQERGSGQDDTAGHWPAGEGQWDPR